MKTVLFAAAVAVGLLGVEAQAASAQQTPQGVVVVNFNAVRGQSLAFQDLNAKLKAMADQQNTAFKSSNQGEIAQLEAGAKTLNAQLEGKSEQDIAANPTLKTQVEAHLQRQQALNKKQQLLEASLEKTSICAQQKLGKALDPILNQIMTAHGASVVLDSGSVLTAKQGVDATAEVLSKLNESTKTATVTWAPVTEGAQTACP